ncbi:FAD-binding oxidoreductase [Agreia sp. COWG]|uniref:FAD-binding oxidoreductase n=1 Tax=Agreia sp. COWG TaxID=2773266 RepID=UPI001925ACE4|nr:FAD-binding protein [Agreia sp. COWG]
MATVSRRHFLLAGSTVAAAGVLTACVGPAPSPSVSPTATPSPVASGPPQWAELTSAVQGALVLPTDDAYESAKITENPRFDDAQPLAVLEVSSAADVAAALAFATKYALPVALRAGGHSYEGWSAGGASGTGVQPSLVISTARLTEVTIAADGTTAQIGAGTSLIDAYSTLGAAGRAIGGGSCATVGVAGLTLGGGMGVLMRSFGLACDQLIHVEIVTADGTVHQATASTDPDLFWASQGGGGGNMGVVTGFTFQTRAAPDVTTFYLEWPWSSAAQVVAAWQSWAPSADNDLWSTLKLLGGGGSHPQGPGVSVSGTWIGEQGDDALAAQLEGLLSGVDAAPDTNQSFQHSYVDAMMNEAGCSGLDIAQCNTGPNGTLARESSSGSSNIGYVALDASGITDLVAQVEAAQQVPGLKEGGISMDALGGAVSTVAPDATAFVHRKALFSVQYTGTFVDGTDPSPIDTYVRGFRSAMTAHWQNWAYVNYSDATIPDAPTAYYGDNLSRLTALKKKFDPHSLFTQPQSP